MPGENTNGNGFGVDATTGPRPQETVACSDPEGATCSPMCFKETDAGPDADSWPHSARSDQTLVHVPARPTDATDSLSSKNCEPKPDSSADLDELRTLDRGSAGPPALPTMAMPRVGCEFLGFRLLAELGAGTFGRVYLGRQERLADRLVVLKIAPHLFDESRTLAQLRHIHIVPIYSVHQTDHFQAVCMPFLGTTTLADLLMDLRRQTVLPESAKYILDQIKKRAHPRAAAGEFPRHDPGSTGHAGPRHSLESMNYVDGVLWLALRLADGLAHAHGCGIVHRDVKPANVLLTDDGMPMLLDFNLSEDRKLDRSASAVGAGGTLRYMAPEQLTHYPTGTCHGDERTDVYSFGVILHELLTGRHPFPQRKNALASACCDGEVKPHQPPKVRHWNPAASPGTESIVRHCLESGAIPAISVGSRASRGPAASVGASAAQICPGAFAAGTRTKMDAPPSPTEHLCRCRSHRRFLDHGNDVRCHTANQPSGAIAGRARGRADSVASGRRAAAAARRSQEGRVFARIRHPGRGTRAT